MASEISTQGITFYLSNRSPLSSESASHLSLTTNSAVEYAFSISLSFFIVIRLVVSPLIPAIKPYRIKNTVERNNQRDCESIQISLSLEIIGFHRSPENNDL